MISQTRFRILKLSKKELEQCRYLIYTTYNADLYWFSDNKLIRFRPEEIVMQKDWDIFLDAFKDYVWWDGGFTSLFKTKHPQDICI